MEITAKFDRELVWRRGGSVRYLVVEAKAPEAQNRKQEAPLNLALVIDASGSMEGASLECAVRAAQGVVTHLGEDDRLSIVSFATEVQDHMTSIHMDAAGKERSSAALAAMRTRDCTHLCAGWLRGAEHVARDMEARSGCQNRVVLLSDGHANRGITDPETLKEYATGLRLRGLFSSTVGIGDGYSPDQIEAIAAHGGGRMHDAERPEELIEVVLAELKETRETAAENLTIRIAHVPEARIKCLSDFPVRYEREEAECSMGTLVAGATRKAVFRVTFPPGEPDSECKFSVNATWHVPGGSDEGTVACAAVRSASGTANSGQSRDIDVSEQVAAIWQAYIVRRVVRLNREGRYDEAQKRLERDLPFFEKYCMGLPSGSELVIQLKKMHRVAAREWSERGRKEIQLAMYQRNRCADDARTTARPEWSKFLPED